MSLETDLRSVLEQVCPRVFPDVAPAATPQPYVTWQQIGGAAFAFADGTLPSKRNARVQINVWSSTRLECNALALQIEAALATTTLFSAEPESALAANEDEFTDLRGAMQDFTIWADR